MHSFNVPQRFLSALSKLSCHNEISLVDVATLSHLVLDFFSQRFLVTLFLKAPQRFLAPCFLELFPKRLSMR